MNVTSLNRRAERCKQAGSAPRTRATRRVRAGARGCLSRDAHIVMLALEEVRPAWMRPRRRRGPGTRRRPSPAPAPRRRCAPSAHAVRGPRARQAPALAAGRHERATGTYRSHRTRAPGRQHRARLLAQKSAIAIAASSAANHTRRQRGTLRDRTSSPRRMNSGERDQQPERCSAAAGPWRPELMYGASAKSQRHCQQRGAKEIQVQQRTEPAPRARPAGRQRATSPGEMSRPARRAGSRSSVLAVAPCVPSHPSKRATVVEQIAD